MCNERTWQEKTFLAQLYWHLAIKLYCCIVLLKESLVMWLEFEQTLHWVASPALGKEKKKTNLNQNSH